MTSKQIKEIIQEGESTTLEFKRKATSPEKLAKEISAFANTKGGLLLIGVDDDGSIVGIKSEKAEIDIVEQACNFVIEPPISPSFDIININGKDVLLVEIEESSSKPHKIQVKEEDGKISFRAHIRLGEKSIIASSEMARLMKYANRDNSEELKLIIGEKEKALFNYLDKYERATVNDFANLVNISKRRAERLMIRLVRAGALQIQNDFTRDYFILR